jgi:murein L,D-transpeptidase YafK
MDKKVVWALVSIAILGLLGYYISPESKLAIGQKTDKIVINKANYELLLFNNEELLASYSVSLGKKGLGKKTREGDNLTPEGRFKGKKRPPSNYHKAISFGEWRFCCGVLIHIH